MPAMRILIIEDDRQAASYLVKAFREAGHVAALAQGEARDLWDLHALSARHRHSALPARSNSAQSGHCGLVSASATLHGREAGQVLSARGRVRGGGHRRTCSPTECALTHIFQRHIAIRSKHTGRDAGVGLWRST